MWQRRDGSRIDISVTTSPIRSVKGRVVGAATILHDITEQKLSEARFHLVVEASPTAMLMVNKAQTITLANRKTEELLGYATEELLGMSLKNLIPVRYRNQHGSHVHGYLDKPGSRAMGSGRDLFGLHKNGNEIPIEIGLNPVKTLEGLYVQASVTDISMRK